MRVDRHQTNRAMALARYMCARKDGLERNGKVGLFQTRLGLQERLGGGKHVKDTGENARDALTYHENRRGAALRVALLDDLPSVISLLVFFVESEQIRKSWCFLEGCFWIRMIWCTSTQSSFWVHLETWRLPSFYVMFLILCKYLTDFEDQSRRIGLLSQRRSLRARKRQRRQDKYSAQWNGFSGVSESFFLSSSSALCVPSFLSFPLTAVSHTTYSVPHLALIVIP